MKQSAGLFASTESVGSIAQSLVDFAAGALSRPCRVQRVADLLACIVEGFACPLRRAFLMAGGEPEGKQNYKRKKLGHRSSYRCPGYNIDRPAIDARGPQVRSRMSKSEGRRKPGRSR